MNLDPTTTGSAVNPHARSEAHTRLRGPWLAAARVAWIALVGLALASFVAALPLFFQTSRTTFSPETQVPGQLTVADAHLLQQWGLSLDFFAAYQTALIALTMLAFTVAGALLFWRKADDRMALFVSLWFALFGLTGNPVLDPLVRAY